MYWQHLVNKGNIFMFFGSRQIIVTKVDGRQKKPKAFDSGIMLRSADAPYKLCVHKLNANLDS